MKLKCKKNSFTYSEGLILKSEKTVTLNMTPNNFYEICISKQLKDSLGRHVLESNFFIEEEYVLFYYSDKGLYEEVVLSEQQNLNDIMNELFYAPENI